MMLKAKDLYDALTQHGFLRPFLIFLALLLTKDVFLTLLELYARWKRPDPRFTTRKHLLLIATRIIPSIAAAAFLAFYVRLIPSIPTAAGRAFGWLLKTFGLQATQILIAIVMVSLGTGAYYFKRDRQQLYGAVEVVVGFLSALFVAGTLAPGRLDLAKCATLAGTAYVVARGIENYKKGQQSNSAGAPRT